LHLRLQVQEQELEQAHEQGDRLGIRDRIRGLGQRAIELVGEVVQKATEPKGASSTVDQNGEAAAAAKAGVKTDNPIENFSPSQVRSDAADLAKAMREAVWGGHLPGPDGAERSFAGFAEPPLIEPGMVGTPYPGIGGGQSFDPFALAKAALPVAMSSGTVPGSPTNQDPKALYWDPFALVQQLGFRERPSAVTYATLSSMVWRVPIVQAILQTRINQASSFATPQHYKFETGFRVKMRDAEAKPTAADKKFIREMERMILNCGVETGSYSHRDSFETFMRKIVRDSLTYDQACWEIVPGQDGRPAEWYAVDAATIRLADTQRLYPDDDPERVRTVQIYDNVIIAEFTAAEMAFMVRNPRTDIRSYGYGTSELEMVVSTVTAILWAWHYNQNFFSQGSVAKGLLNLVGAIPEKQLRAFRRQWYQMVSGIENAWRTPITNAEKVEWIDMHASNRDMEFSAWMDFLIKVVSSVYVMDPVEINFKYGTSATRSMFEGAQRAKSQESRERGLKPLLRAIGREIDRSVVWPINPDFTVEFLGLESQTPKELADLMTQRVRTIYTIDEVRAENDMDPLPDGLGGIILDANWLNNKSQVEQRQQQEQQMAQQAQLQQQTAGGGVGELEGLLAQLEGRAPKIGAPTSKPGGFGGGTPGAPKGGAKTGGPGGPGVKETTTQSGRPGSTPSQTNKQIAAELQGVGTSPIEASLVVRGEALKKSSKSVIEINL
jgi:hypothetical protein